MTDRWNRRLAACFALLVPFAAVLAVGCSQPDRESAVAPSGPVAATAPARAPGASRPRILAFGDSLTAGYGIQKSESYPSVLQRMLDERGYVYEVVNSGVSGETRLAGAAASIRHSTVTSGSLSSRSEATTDCAGFRRRI
ncbi:MAG: hypothetical protein IPF82_17605 [Blastocatellia bacterium]|nr:hypothetical protein [Blastocatellia bacterium]